MSRSTIVKSIITVVVLLGLFGGFGRNNQALAAPTAANLIAHWEFEEGSGTTAADSTPNNYDGTIFGANWSTSVAPAASGTRSLTFDGSNDYVDSYDFAINNDFTVAAWINPDSTSNRAIIARNGTGSSNHNILLVGFYGGGYHVALQNQTFQAGTPTTGWQHILVTGVEVADGTDVTLYRNGIKLWEHRYPTKFNDTSGGRLWTIGQEWDGNSRTDYFDGNIDDVRIYDDALSASEIATLTAGFANVCNVPSPYATVSDAVAEGVCDIVDVAAGSFEVNTSISQNLLIRGAGETATFLTVPAGGNRRAFHNTSGNSFTLQNLTVQNGHTTGSTPGGGVYNDFDAILLLESVTFLNNSAEGLGGAIYSFGRVFADTVTFDSNNADSGGAFVGAGGSESTIRNSEFVGNSADTLGGAIYFVGDESTASISDSNFVNNTAGAEGGAINIETMGQFFIDRATFTNNSTSGFGGAILNNTLSNLTISNSTISNNTALGGGGIYTANDANTIIQDSSVVGNDATGTDGGVHDGGGIRTINASATIIRTYVGSNTANNANAGGVSQQGSGQTIISDSTIYANNAPGGGGVHNFGSSVSIINSTITGNTALGVGGGGLRVFNNGTTRIENSIIANNNFGDDCRPKTEDGSQVISDGNNLDSDGTCSLEPIKNDLPNVDPLLGSIANNGGPTLTFLPGPDSPAIDAAGYDCTSSDQRGVERPNGLHVNGVTAPTNRCDIGAVELGDGRTGQRRHCATTFDRLPKLRFSQ